MGLDENIVSIIRELVQFLEILDNVELPTAVNHLRQSLLIRSKEAIHELSIQEPLSGGGYLDMSVWKGFSLVTNAEVEEYVNLEKRESSITKAEYETFAEVQKESIIVVTNNTSQKSTTENVFNIYKTFSVEQTKTASEKCGPLEYKERKKFFLFGQYRNFWAGLVGMHLLLYTSAYANCPYDILSLRDYKVRPAPTAVQRKNDAAFEIFSPGNKTMVFIARTEKDMEQWVAAICRVGCSENDLEQQSMANCTSKMIETNSDVVTNESKSIEKLEDVSIQGFATEGSPKRSANTKQNTDIKKENDKHVSPNKDIFKNNDNPPALPTRTPCRFPAMPLKSNIHSLHSTDDTNQYIYEDIREYGNIPKRKISKTAKDNNFQVYDDAQSVVEEARAMKKPEIQEREMSIQETVINLETENIYDDAFSCSSKSNDQNENSQKSTKEPTKLSSNVSNDRDYPCYDDVHGVAMPVKPKKEQQKSKEERQTSLIETPRKKSFLDRIRNKRDSPKKEENTCKRSLPPTPKDSAVFIYDDILNVKATIDSNMKTQSNTPIQMETSEYHFPPPPEPIYNSPTVANPGPELKEEFYMNVVDTQENGMEHHNDETVQWEIENQKVIKKNNIVPLAVTDKEESFNSEHYQAPNSNPLTPVSENDDVTENYYDDVAIVREKVRLTRLALEEREKASDNKINVSSSPEKPTPEKKLWNRFIASKKHKATEESNLETNKSLTAK